MLLDHHSVFFLNTEYVCKTEFEIFGSENIRLSASPQHRSELFPKEREPQRERERESGSAQTRPARILPFIYIFSFVFNYATLFLGCFRKSDASVFLRD